MRVCVKAPSNIALIKYMGKQEGTSNLPENSSLSLTLNALCSFAEISTEKGSLDRIRWIPELPRNEKSVDLKVPDLNEKGIARIQAHAERVRQELPAILSPFGIVAQAVQSPLVLRTANTFPPASGIASSASSFAAVTLAVAVALSEAESFQRAWESEMGLRRVLAQISRQGSGSSCRSFEGPWVLWEKDTSRAIQTQMPNIAHFVILLESSAKTISSSEAHARVKTSPLWMGRVARVQQRLEKMIQAMQQGDFKTVSQLAWSETWEMHSLFHTSSEPFSYWTGPTMDTLQWIRSEVFSKSAAMDAIVTLDAGPNIHVLVEQKNQDVWRNRLKTYCERFPNVRVLEDQQGKGAERVRVSS